MSRITSLKFINEDDQALLVSASGTKKIIIRRIIDMLCFLS